MSTEEGVDVVYGVHAFEAENPDELSFGAGERIVVLEKDDQYQDGWWQVGRAICTGTPCKHTLTMISLALPFLAALPLTGSQHQGRAWVVPPDLHAVLPAHGSHLDTSRGSGWVQSSSTR